MGLADDISFKRQMRRNIVAFKRPNATADLPPPKNGTTGDMGPKGEKGDKGESGDKGPTGNQGPPGVTGATVPGWVRLDDITLSQTAAVAIALGPRVLTVLCVGAMVGDKLMILPTNLPAGYMIANAVCTANGQVTVTVYAPALAIGASYSISAMVLAFR